MTTNTPAVQYVADGNGSITTTRTTLSPRQVVLRTLYAGVNRGDLLGLAGAYGEPFPAGRPVGQDIVGVVEAAGSDELSHLVGSTMFGQIGGAWASHAVADAHALAPIGDLPLQTAAALPLAGFTALRLARAAQTTLGTLDGLNALITGGTGAVGGMLSDILVADGAQVELLPRRPVTSPGPEAKPEEAAVDLVFESVGGDTMDRALRRLKPGGHAWWFGEVTRQSITLNFFDYLGSPWHLHHFSHWVHDSTDAADLNELARLVQSKVLTPPATVTIQTGELPAAVAEITRGTRRGKVIVDGTGFGQVATD